jgi:hypothetical protein
MRMLRTVTPKHSSRRDTTAASIERERALELQTLKVPRASFCRWIFLSGTNHLVLWCSVSSWDCCRASSSCGLPTLDFTFGINFPATFPTLQDQELEVAPACDYDWRCNRWTLYMILKAPGIGAVRSFVPTWRTCGNPETITVVSGVSHS